ncbi:MAG TPA: cytochrome P450 [Pedomonas sp.]|uniref:cytochrome P450 n=1 Tax=Pedomonas sp. TaxID=2976421 RepID=UPI002F425E81
MSAAAPLMPEIDFAYDDLPDLHDVLDALRQAGPVVPVQFHGQVAWLVLSHAELAQAFTDTVNFDPAPGYLERTEESMGRTLLGLTGDEHRITRAMVAAPFMPARVRQYVQPLIEPIVQELLDRIEGQEEVEFVSAFTRPFPFTVITRLLSIPVADEALFLKWAVKLIDHPWDPDGAMEAKAGFDAYMEGLIEDRRHRPQDDFITMLVQSEFEGRTLDNERILSLFRLLFPAGSDTTYKNGGSLFAAVLSDPAVRALAAQGSDADRAAIVTEGLRWQTPTALLPRMAPHDAELGGVRIKAGDWMLFGITAANHDPMVYKDPRRFDPARDNRELLSFGRGVHFCLGMHLARRELETALRLVFERFPALRLTPGKPVEFISAILRGPRALWVQPYGGSESLSGVS